MSGLSRKLTYSPSSPEAVALARDPVMLRVISAIGEVSVGMEPDRFEALARAIVGQQLSTSAATTIWGRLASLGPVGSSAFLALDGAQFRAAGLSRSKIVYLCDLAERVASGDLALAGLDSLSDDEVIAELTRVKGIGRWTAEMFLVFSLGRPDVLAVDDLGLRRAGGWALEFGRTAEPAELAAAGERWRPYRSVASLYLWACLDRGLVPRNGQGGGLTPREPAGGSAAASRSSRR